MTRKRRILHAAAQMIRRFSAVFAVALVAYGCEAPVALAPDEALHTRVPGLPPAPVSLTATTVSPTLVHLNWRYQGASDTEVHIERSLTTPDNFALIATLPAHVTTYGDGGVEPGQQYWYRLRSCAGALCSAYTNAVAATTPAPAPPVGPWTVMSVSQNLASVSGVSESSVLALGAGAALKFDGNGWVQVPLPFFNAQFQAAWAAAENAMYGLTLCGPVTKYNGVSWSVIGPSWQLTEPEDPEDPRQMCWYYWDIWGPSPDELIMVGEFGQAARYDGTTWVGIPPGPINVFTDELNGVWGASATDVFVVGGDVWGNKRAAILHYDGATWTHMVTSDATDLPVLRKVWGSSATDVFAVGDEGTIVHFDGAQWSPMDSGTTAHLSSVWGNAPDNVFAVGSAGTLLHYDGTGWSSLASGTTVSLRSVWVASTGAVFAVGNGVIAFGVPDTGS